MRSKSTKAKPFRQWVTNEVLPSIRKTGSYNVTQSQFKIPQTYAEALLEAVIGMFEFGLENGFDTF